MVITTTQVTQMHDIAKTLQDRPESVQEILWSEGPWLGEELWVNEILTEDTSRQRETMNGTISQLNKGGGTNRPSDQRPLVLLNSVYQ